MPQANARRKKIGPLKKIGLRLVDGVSRSLDSVVTRQLIAHASRNGADSPFRREEVRSILVFDVWAIGDMILSSPLLRELRLSFPGAHITLVAQHYTLALFEHCPYVDEVLPLDVGALNLLSSSWAECLKGYVFASRLLQKRDFDLAVGIHWCTDLWVQSSVVYFSQARWRIGFCQNAYVSEYKASECDVFYTNIIDSEVVLHEVERKLKVIEALGGAPSSDALEIWTDTKDEQYAEALVSIGSKKQLLVGMGVGTAKPGKQWPTERYAQLAEWLIDEHDAIIVVVGNEKERSFANAVAHRRPGHVINAAGTTTILQCAALLKRCALYIGNDTSTKHMAAAAGVPVVEVSAEAAFRPDGSPASSKLVARWYPWRTRHRIVQPHALSEPCRTKNGFGDFVFCAFDEAHCILAVSVDEVKDAVTSLMEECQLVPRPRPQQADARPVQQFNSRYGAPPVITAACRR